MLTTPGRGRGMTVDVYYDSDKPHHQAELSSTSSEDSPVKLAANFASFESRNGQQSPHAAYRMEPLSPPTAQQQWQQQHSLLPQHKHILLQHHQSQQQHLQQQHIQQQQEFIMLQQQQQQQQQICEDVGYQQQHQQLQDFQIQQQTYQPYQSIQSKSPQAAGDNLFKQLQQHDQQETPHRLPPQQLRTSKQHHNNSHPQQIRILKRQPQQLQQQQQELQGQQQQLQLQGQQQQLQLQGQQQQQLQLQGQQQQKLQGQQQQHQVKGQQQQQLQGEQQQLQGQHQQLQQLGQQQQQLQLQGQQQQKLQGQQQQQQVKGQQQQQLQGEQQQLQGQHQQLQQQGCQQQHPQQQGQQQQLQQHGQHQQLQQQGCQQEQQQQQGQQQQLQQQGQHQQQQQQRRQQRQITTSPPQVSFTSMVAPSLFPSNISPMDLTSFIDTSVPPPPIGVPIPGLHFPVSAKSPPLMYPTTSAFHAQPPSPTKPCEPSPQHPKTSPDLQHTHRSKPVSVKWEPDGNSDHGSAFTSIQDSPWDNMELGGGYSSPVTMNTGLRGSSPVFVPKAANLPQSQEPSQNDHFQIKRTSVPIRDAAQGPKQWIKKDKAKGRGIPKKDIKGTSANQHPKPQQGYNVFPQGYGTTPNSISSSYQGQGWSKQHQDASKSALQLSKEQKKNEYEWQSFKIIRKVRKLLGGLKEESAKEKEIAAEIVSIMKAESSRLACFPWPKEQFVALDEIFGWVMDNSELLDKTCKVIQELHCLHPQNFQEDLLNSVMKRQSQYIKVSTATNKEKLYTTFCGLLTKLFIRSRSATNGLDKIIDKLLDSIVNKWITCDVQGTADDPSLLTEVYASCLSALFVNIGPKLASSMDQRYYKLLRDQVLGGKPRFVKEAMLNLLLLRAADWQEEAFTKKNSFPEDLKETPNTAQRCGTTGEGTEVSDEVNGTKEALQMESVTSKSEDLTKTDQTRPSAEMTTPADEVVSSITPKTQQDNRQSVTAVSSHSSNSNNSNSFQESAARPQNFTTGINNGTLQPQDRPQSMQSKPTSDVSYYLPLDNLQSSGKEDTEPLLSSTDIYGPPCASEDAAFHKSNDTPTAAAYLQQDGKLSSPSRVAGTAIKPRSSPATGRGMMRFEQSLTSPLAFIQSGPPQGAAFKRYVSESLEKETTTDQLSRDLSSEGGQFSTICPTQDSKPSSTLKSSQDHCEERPDCIESSPGADGTTTEDVGKLGDWPNPKHSQESFEEINDEYFASQGDGTQQFSQVNSDESSDQQGTGGEQQTCFMAGEAMSEKKREEQGLEGGISSDENLGHQDLLASSSNIPLEDSQNKQASTVSDKTPVGLGQYEQIESTKAPSQPASPQVSNCSLCGSDKHRTRQCATFKKYAPHVKTSDCEPETTETPKDDVHKPNTEKFGSIIFCSKCGQKGHLVYDCPIKGSFNIFNNDTSII